MKRSLLILILTIPIIASIVIGIGYKRGNSCPAYIGNAYYQLNPSADINSIEPLLLKITGKYGSHYNRWGDSKTPEDGIAAHRRSLRYNISKNEGGYLLHISSLADKDWVAVDAPAFCGIQAHYPLLSDGYLDGLEAVRRVTDWEKIKYGLGLFPVGKTLSEVELVQSEAPVWASPVFPEIETYINNYTLSPTQGSTTTLNLHQWNAKSKISDVSYSSQCGYVGKNLYTLKLTYKGTQGGNDHYIASISYTLDSTTQTLEKNIVYQGEDLELFKDQDWRIGVRPHTKKQVKSPEAP